MIKDAWTWQWCHNIDLSIIGGMFGDLFQMMDDSCFELVELCCNCLFQWKVEKSLLINPVSQTSTQASWSKCKLKQCTRVTNGSERETLSCLRDYKYSRRFEKPINSVWKPDIIHQLLGPSEINRQLFIQKEVNKVTCGCFSEIEVKFQWIIFKIHLTIERKLVSWNYKKSRKTLLY